MKLSILRNRRLRLVIPTLKILPNLYLGGRRYCYFFPRKANVILYITNRCNSRCIICNHWEQTPKIDLSLSIIEKLLNSRSINKDSFLIEGGEAILHPDFEEIMKLLKGRHFVLLTNGILTERIVKLVEKYKIPIVSVSLDGRKSTYKYMRGVDEYENVLKTIDLLKDKTNLSVCFTVAPWNTYEDYLDVKRICQEKNLKLSLNIFSKMDYMGVREKETSIDHRFEQVDSPYVRLYNRWVEGKSDIRCFSMRFLAVIRPNGDVRLCQYKNIVLGKLYQKSFDQIWNDENIKSIQRAHMACNDCWVSSHRAFDAKFTLLIKKILPWISIK